MNKGRSISFVIPVFNERENIVQLHAEIRRMCKTNNYESEIILVDDGSTDQTPEAARRLMPVKLVRFRKNFGQTAALDAGIKQARYDLIVTLDGDLQNDPADVPRMIQYMEEQKLHMVCGWRKDRKDSFTKKITSRGANLLRKILFNDTIHDSGCTLKLFRRECMKNLHLYGEMHRFIPALLLMRGYRVGEIAVGHRPRSAGKTKYNWKRTLKGLVDMISISFWERFSVRPLHVFGTAGLLLILLSMVSGAATLLAFMAGKGMSETALPLLTAFLFLGGLQMFICGLMTDLLMKNYFESTLQQPYYVEAVEETSMPLIPAQESFEPVMI